MEYDSILKEEKVYKDPEVHHSKYTKYVVGYVLLSLVVLVGSYWFYYNRVLSPSNVFFYDISTILGDYEGIISHVIPNNLGDSGSLEGSINISDIGYNYGIVLKDNYLGVELSNLDKYLFYQEKENGTYVELSELDEKIIEIDSKFIFNKIKTFKKDMVKYLSDEKFVKRFYMDGSIPVVEVNLVLKNTDLEILLGIDIKDEYEVVFTFKNNAISNEILDGKLVIRNLTKNSRDVYTYLGDKIGYTDNFGNKYYFSLSINREDFNLRIYKEDVLYSIFIGKKLEKTYQYTYQIIDQVYTLNLDVTKEGEEYHYEFSSNIENDGIESKRSMNIILYSSKNSLLEENNGQIVEYTNLTKEEKDIYNDFLDEFFLPIREFVDEYKNGVNKFDEENRVS